MLLSIASAAQVTIGSEVTLNANGTLSAGYNDTYGNDIESSHGIGIGGAAALNGFFYNPNFLSFTVNPYYNQSRSNSDIGSVSDASGVSLNTAIFSGSHFPGSVNYAANLNTTGSYGIPGIASLNTNGNNQTFGINWGAYVAGLPTLQVGYQQGTSNYSLYGTDENGNANFKNFNLNSTYDLHGFGLSGGVSHGTSNSLVPGVILDGQTAASNSVNTTYVFGVAHTLPWNGNFTTNFNRTDLDSNYLGYTFDGNIDVLTSNAAFHPTPKLTLAFSSDYTDNLSGSLYQAVVPGTSSSNLSASSGSGIAQNQSTSGTTGGALLPTGSSESSHGLTFLFDGSYSFATNLQAIGQFERRQQDYLGESFGSNVYSGGVIYNRLLAGGYFGAAVNLIDSTVDNSGQNGLGFNVSSSYSRHFGEWAVAAYLNYAENVQTLLVNYNTSFYNYSVNLSRQFGKWYWSASGAAGHSLLVDEPGTSTSSESFGTNLGRRKFTFAANYSKSNGNALAGGSGLMSTPLPPIIPPNLLVMYGGTSYAFSASALPVRRFTVAASYVKAKNNLDNLGVASLNSFEEENLYMQYQFRQLGVNAGYTRLEQGFSASPTPAANISSFYIGVYRWFNFF